MPDTELVELNLVDSAGIVLFVFSGIEGTHVQFNYLASLLEAPNVRVYSLEFTLKVPTDSFETIAWYFKDIIYK